MSVVYKTGEGGRAVRKGYDAVLESWPVPFERLRVPTTRGETFVVACGPVDAPPLVLLHGTGTNSAMWMGDVAAWSEHSRGTRRRLEAAVPGATVEVLPRTGHLIPRQTRPILDFLRTRERTP